MSQICIGVRVVDHGFTADLVSRLEAALSRHVTVSSVAIDEDLPALAIDDLLVLPAERLLSEGQAIDAATSIEDNGTIVVYSHDGTIVPGEVTRILTRCNVDYLSTPACEPDQLISFILTIFQRLQEIAEERERLE